MRSRQAAGTDLGAVGWRPSAGGDLSIGVPVVRVKTGEVEGGAVEPGEGRRPHRLFVDAGEGGESRHGFW